MLVAFSGSRVRIPLTPPMGFRIIPEALFHPRKILVEPWNTNDFLLIAGAVVANCPKPPHGLRTPLIPRDMFGALFGAIRGCIGQHAYRPGSPVARKPCVVSTDAEGHLRDISVSAEAEQESSAGAECAVSGGRLRPTTGVIGEMRVRRWSVWES